MAITRVRLHRQLHPFRRGGYAMHYGSVAGEESFVVALEDDSGITGYGEVAMLDGRYSEAFPAGVPAGVGFLAPTLLGLDATDPAAVAGAMDHELLGQAYIKTAVDIAAWDAAGKARNVPLCALTGGTPGEAVALYDVVTAGGSDDEAVALALDLLARGFRRLQVKVGGDPAADAARLRRVRSAVPGDVVLFADANTGFGLDDARAFLAATADLDFTFEQPCATIDECAALRDACPHPLVLDESITTLEDLRRAHRDAGADGVTIKLGRVGGITPAVAIRDEAVALGMTVTVEAIGGASIGTAAFTHLAVGVPAPLRCHTVDFHRWWTADNGTGMPAAVDGAQSPPTGPGLGIAVDEAALGAPILDVVA